MPEGDLKVHEDRKVDTSHGDHERFAHYVDKNDMMNATVFGTPIKALCGKVWVPSRDPKKHPVCPECKEIYESLPPGDDGDGAAEQWANQSQSGQFGIILLVLSEAGSRLLTQSIFVYPGVTFCWWRRLAPAR